MDMVQNYTYLRITIDSRFTFTRHVAETKLKVDSRFNMIKAILNLKIRVNTLNMSQHAHDSVHVLDTLGYIILRKNTKNSTKLPLGPSTLIYRESGIDPSVV